jgi:hypothetical protein
MSQTADLLDPAARTPFVPRAFPISTRRPDPRDGSRRALTKNPDPTSAEWACV